MITEDKLLTDAQRINRIKKATEKVSKKKANKLLNRKRDHEEALYLNKLMGDL